MSARKVLVIGGTGFIGRRLVRELLEAGTSVRVLSRRGGTSSGGVEHVQGTVADAAAIRRAVEGVSVVFDLSLGGGPRWEDFERDYIRGARNVARACLEHGVSRLVYTSTTAALYLGAEGTIDEKAGTDPKPEERGFYSRAKIAAEKLLLELHRTRSLPVVILRPAIVVGDGGRLAHPGIGQWLSPTCCMALGEGRSPLPFVLVEDVAQAMVLAADAPGVEGEAFNLAGDVRPTAEEYVRLVAQRSRRNFRFRRQSVAGFQASRLLTWAVKATLRRPDNEWPSWHDLKSATKRSQLDCTAAKTRLGWRPNGNVEDFARRAIDPHLRPIPPGDLRLENLPMLKAAG